MGFSELRKQEYPYFYDAATALLGGAGGGWIATYDGGYLSSALVTFVIFFVVVYSFRVFGWLYGPTEDEEEDKQPRIRYAS